MPPAQLTFLTTITMLAFAGNSLLCRLALSGGSIDAASFTSIRIAAGATALWALDFLRRGSGGPAGNWLSSAALLGYAAGFSFAYVSLPTAPGRIEISH